MTCFVLCFCFVFLFSFASSFQVEHGRLSDSFVVQSTREKGLQKPEERRLTAQAALLIWKPSGKANEPNMRRFNLRGLRPTVGDKPRNLFNGKVRL